MEVGIIGFARSGKTTIFNALTGAHAQVGTFGSRDANVAVLRVPDERVEKLAAIFKPKKTVHAEFRFVDAAPNEADGERKALDPDALGVLRQADALVHVVRAFEDQDVMHPHGTVDPARDCRDLEEELRLADLIVIEKRLERLEKEHNLGAEHQVLVRAREHIESGAPLRTMELTGQEAKELSGFCFLSQKPLLLVGNYGEKTIGDEDPAHLSACAIEQGLPVVALCGEMEMEIVQLAEEERQTFRDEWGLGEGSRMEFVHAAHDLLGLIIFFTCGDAEVHARTIPDGTKAVEAAACVHSDMARGFIRAEVVGCGDLVAAGSMAKAKEGGHVHLEGKEYLVQDGDVILFRFNV